jgi:Sel1 repeat
MRRLSLPIVVFALIIAPTFLQASSQEAPRSSSQSSISSLLVRAEKGDVEAQRELGIAYDQGEGVQQDYQQALKWYLKAAEQHDAVAENNIGVLYRLGNGVPKNFSTAVSWYAKAARKELPAALMNFGIAYYNGEGVPDDRVQAYGWLSLSAEQGYQPAKDAIASIRHELSECDISSRRSASRGGTGPFLCKWYGCESFSRQSVSLLLRGSHGRAAKCRGRSKFVTQDSER